MECIRLEAEQRVKEAAEEVERAARYLFLSCFVSVLHYKQRNSNV